MMRNYQLPTCEQVMGTFSLLSLTIDSAVSQQGKRQILDCTQLNRISVGPKTCHL